MNTHYEALAQIVGAALAGEWIKEQSTRIPGLMADGAKRRSRKAVKERRNEPKRSRTRDL